MKYTFLLFIGILLINSQIKAQTPEELKSWLPDIEDWNIKSDIETFDSENLFDRINGAAPLFIENNFQEMTSLEYTKGDDYITIQIYRHASPEDAFGMYASERSTELEFFPIGGEAHGDDSNFYFFAGNVYVKMWSSSQENVSTIILRIAKRLADKIDSNANYPSIVKAFPKKDKIEYSEAYITANYIGHEFLKGVYIAQYQKDDQSFQAFIIDGKNKDEAENILKRYFTFTKQPLEFTEGTLIINDRYNGNIPIYWKGKYIVGIFSEDGSRMKNEEEFLKETSENLN